MSKQIEPKTKRTAEADPYFQPPQARSQTSNPNVINSITRCTHSHRISNSQSIQLDSPHRSLSRNAACDGRTLITRPRPAVVDSSYKGSFVFDSALECPHAAQNLARVVLNGFPQFTQGGPYSERR